MPSQVTIFQQVGNTYCIIYESKSNALALEVMDWDEFRGFGYVDGIWRVQLGLSQGNVLEQKYMTGASWYIEEAWHHGTVKGWEDAGSPPKVYFHRLRDLFRVDIH